MSITYYSLALVIGLTLSLLCDNFFGIVPGGMIVPGFLAMTACEDIRQFFLVFAVSFVIYAFVHFVLEKIMILYGSRVFAACLITSAVIKYILDWVLPGIYTMNAFSFHIIGVITPALLANRYLKQTFQYTIPSTIIVAYATYFLTIAIGVLSLKYNAVIAVIIVSVLLAVLIFGAKYISIKLHRDRP